MNKPVAELKAEAEVTDDPLARLRAPFPDNLISKLPKETKAQADQRKAEQAKGTWPAKCAVCDGYHHPRAVHLDYVGHAALTDRLLDVDPHWSWEPVAFRDGLPAFDGTGGLWIKLTVCGVTRLGYGHAGEKKGGDAIKEIIGDALRNAAMRFGAALDLWHKGDLHPPEDEGPAPSLEEKALNVLRGASADRGLLKETWEKNRPGWKATMDRAAYARVVAEVSRLVEALPKDEPPPPPADDFGLDGDSIPDWGDGSQ